MPPSTNKRDFRREGYEAAHDYKTLDLADWVSMEFDLSDLNAMLEHPQIFELQLRDIIDQHRKDSAEAGYFSDYVRGALGEIVETLWTDAAVEAYMDGFAQGAAEVMRAEILEYRHILIGMEILEPNDGPRPAARYDSLWALVPDLPGQPYAQAADWPPLIALARMDRPNDRHDWTLSSGHSTRFEYFPASDTVRVTSVDYDPDGEAGYTLGPRLLAELDALESAYGNGLPRGREVGQLLQRLTEEDPRAIELVRRIIGET